jgi:hypothetical protein
MDLIACAPADPLRDVDFHVTTPQYDAAGGHNQLRPGQDRSQAPHYLAESKRHGKAIIGAGLECVDFILQRAAGANQNDPKVR